MNKTTDKIAKLSLKPILDRLSKTAREQVEENFCMPHCGRTPHGEEEFCDDAEYVLKRYLSRLFRRYSKLN